jgi:tetratricopeptide (TPR) repeat protein
VRKGGREDLDEARRLLEWALVRDPNSSDAHSVLALCHFQQALLGWNHDPAKALAGTLRAARAAVALEDEDWLAHTLLGIASLWTLRDYERALEEQDRALELNPSAALSHQFRACVQLFAGCPEDAVRSLECVLRLEPRYQSRSMILADLALNHLIMGDAGKAAGFARRAIDDAPDNVRAHQRLVAALGHADDHAATEAALNDLLTRQPDVCIEDLVPTYPFRREEDWQVFSGGLRAAGVPETR